MHDALATQCEKPLKSLKHAAEEPVDAGIGVCACWGWEGGEAVGGVLKDVQDGFVAGGLPSGGHHQGVVEEGVEGAYAEDGGGHVAEVG